MARPSRIITTLLFAITLGMGFTPAVQAQPTQPPTTTSTPADNHADQVAPGRENLEPAEPGFDDNNVDNQTGKNWHPTTNPKSKITPGKMRSDKEQIPGGFTKEQANQAEIQEAKEQATQTRSGVQTFAAVDNCRTYWPSPFKVCGKIREKYDSLGGPKSFLTWPKSNELGVPDGVGRRNEFVNGFIYWHPQTGAHPITTHFSVAWARTGWERGPLGYPTTDEFGLSDGIGRKQSFQRGHIYGSLAGLATIHGAIYDKWVQTGAEKGPLGYPIGDETGTPDGIGRFNRFTGGMMYWHPQHGAHQVAGDILFQWGYADFEKGFWGYPTGDPVKQKDGWYKQTFTKGPLYGLVANGLADLYNPHGGDGLNINTNESIIPNPLSRESNAIEGNDYTNRIMLETSDACGNEVVLRRGYWDNKTGFGWDKIYHKHNVRSLYSLAYFIKHSCPARYEDGRPIYESPVYRVHCETPVTCEPTGEWFTGRLVYDKTPVVDSGKPLGTITFYPLKGTGEPTLTGVTVPDWFSTELPVFP